MRALLSRHAARAFKNSKNQTRFPSIPLTLRLLSSTPSDNGNGTYGLFSKHLEKMGEAELLELGRALGVPYGHSRAETIRRIAQGSTSLLNQKHQRKEDNDHAPSSSSPHIDHTSNSSMKTALEQDGTVSMPWVMEMTDLLQTHARTTTRLKSRTPPLPKPLVLHILTKSLEQMRTLPTLIDISIPPNTTLSVCGDTHGQFFDLLNIFTSSIASWPSSTNAFVFNGDFIDRGLYSFEVIFSLLALKLANPDTMHLIRGNHETTDMNSMYGFESQVLEIYDWEVLCAFRAVFDSLPLAAIVEKAAFIVHGGIGPVSSRMNLAQLRAMRRGFVDEDCSRSAKRPTDESRLQQQIAGELLWADPLPQVSLQPLQDPKQPRGFHANTARGGGWCFGPDVTGRFLSNNSLGLLLRSHEARADGFTLDHQIDDPDEDGRGGGDNGVAPLRCITVFSAPNYCDSQGNLGALVRFTNAGETHPLDLSSVAAIYGGKLESRSSTNKVLEYSIIQFPAVPHPKSSKNALKIIARQHDQWAHRSRKSHHSE